MATCLCGAKAKSRGADRQPRCEDCRKKARAPRFCLHCRQEFTPWRVGQDRFCSRRCKVKAGKRAWQKRAQAKRPKVERKDLRKVCRHGTLGKSTCKQCWREAYKKIRQEVVSFACLVCGAEVVTPVGCRGTPRRLCSARCRNARLRATNPSKQAGVRRARERNAVVERFKNTEIFERDGYRCQLCGYECERDPLGLLGATLDHIVPLSRGGLHSRANVRTAHRICNSLRGNDMGSGVEILQLTSGGPAGGFARLPPRFCPGVAGGSR